MSKPGGKLWQRLEQEIERNRAHLRWDKIHDLLEQLSGYTKHPELEPVVCLYQAEYELEKYLLEHPVSADSPAGYGGSNTSISSKSRHHHHRRHQQPQMVAAAKEEAEAAQRKEKMAKPRKQLEQCMRSTCMKSELRIQAHLLLAKLHFTLAHYGEVLTAYDKLGLEELTIEASGAVGPGEAHMTSRTLMLVAEAYAIKGFSLCNRQMSHSSPGGSPRRGKSPGSTDYLRYKNKVIEYLEKASRLAIAYLQDQDKQVTSVTLTNQQVLGSMEGEFKQNFPLLHQAVQRAPVMLLDSDLRAAVDMWRHLLNTVECQGSMPLRQQLARQLAEVMLRGVSEKSYAETLGYDAYVTREKEGDTNKKEGAADGAASPASVSITSSTGADRVLSLVPAHYQPTPDSFRPQNQTEETLLLLLISEYYATRDAVLSRFKEEEERRQGTLQDVVSVYDLLAICLVRKCQYRLLCECFQRAMRFSYEEFYIWYQFGLSLISAGNYARALLVMRECSLLRPDHAPCMLLAAKLCFSRLMQIDQGIEWAEKAVQVTESPPQGPHHGSNSSGKQLLLPLEPVGPLACKAYIALGIGCRLKATAADQTQLQAQRARWHARSLEAFTRAKELDDQEPYCDYHLALALAHTRQIDEAVAHLERALEQNNEHVDFLHLMALLLTAQEAQGGPAGHRLRPRGVP